MGKIAKQRKIEFANAFMQTSNGLLSLELAGLPKNYETLRKLLNDNFINSYIEENMELAEIYRGNSRDAHIAKLEKLFDETTGTTESTIYKFTKDGFLETRKGFFTSPSEAAKLSERIEKLKGWDKQGQNNNIVVDLKLSKDTDPTAKAVELEEGQDRENKVLEHFKKEGLL